MYDLDSCIVVSHVFVLIINPVFCFLLFVCLFLEFSYVFDIFQICISSSYLPFHSLHFIVLQNYDELWNLVLWRGILLHKFII